MGLCKHVHIVKDYSFEHSTRDSDQKSVPTASTFILCAKPRIFSVDRETQDNALLAVLGYTYASPHFLRFYDMISGIPNQPLTAGSVLCCLSLCVGRRQMLIVITLNTQCSMIDNAAISLGRNDELGAYFVSTGRGRIFP